MANNWMEQEIMVAVYLYRFGFEEIGLPYWKIAQIINRSPEAIFMKLSNLLNADQGHGGLTNIGKNDIEVLNVYKNIPKYNLHNKVVQYLFDRATAYNR